MKRITEVLRKEHRLIARAAACLDRVADDAMETDDLRIVSALQLLEFFEEFADAAHQEKEERHLFPALLAAGVGRLRVTELAVDHALQIVFEHQGRDRLGLHRRGPPVPAIHRFHRIHGGQIDTATGLE